MNVKERKRKKMVKEQGKVEVKEQEGVFVEMEIVNSAGKRYSNYFVRTTIDTWDYIKAVRVTEEMRIRMDVPRNDTAMYKLLNSVFMGEKKKQLFKVPHKKNVNGKTQITYTFEVINEETGLSATLVPVNVSNTTLLDKEFAKLGKPVEDDAEVVEEE